jgi:hypothetical protein
MKFKDLSEERSHSPHQSTFTPLEDISALENVKVSYYLINNLVYCDESTLEIINS